MHILLGILGLIAGLGFLLWRINQAAQAARDLGDAARDLGDLAGEAANVPRKMRFRAKARKGGLDVIDDAREAAAVILYSAARTGGEVGAEQKALIRQEMERAFRIDPEEGGELLARAVWHSAGILEPVDMVRRMTDFLAQRVTKAELTELAAMIERVTAMAGGPDHEKKLFILRYRERAGLK